MSMLQELLILLEKLSCSSFFLNSRGPSFQLCCMQNIFPHLKSVLDNLKNDSIWFEKGVKVLKVKILGTVCSIQPPANWSARPGHNLYDLYKLDRMIFFTDCLYRLYNSCSTGTLHNKQRTVKLRDSST